MRSFSLSLLIATLFLALWALGVYIALRYIRRHPAGKTRGLSRHEGNPVVKPRSEYAWESNATFNPAIILDDEGNVHMFYRAIGEDGLSRLGYAMSKDGITFEKRSPYPVYQPTHGYGLPNGKRAPEPAYNPLLYTSGGGWGGCEDPRAVKIDGRVYMTYVAFEGWNSVRIGLTSIALDDLKNGRWNWKQPTLISAPGEIHKNWVLFPEKINGKFAVLHGVSPSILIDYVDSLEELENGERYIRSAGPKGGREEYWDNWMRGVGPPPVKTPYGWLMLYHAMDKKDPNKYKLGAMILDLDDPTKVLYRSPEPILEPLMHYENDGKPGVVYASGTVIKDDTLYVYYGSGDKTVSVATVPLAPFLKHLSRSPASA